MRTCQHGWRTATCQEPADWKTITGAGAVQAVCEDHAALQLEEETAVGAWPID